MKNWKEFYRVSLAGGFDCELTCEEVNNWHEFCITTPEFLACEEFEASRWASENCRDTQDFNTLRAIHNEGKEAKRALYLVAKRWFAALRSMRDEAFKEEMSRRAAGGM